MNKNKKITLLTSIALLTTVFATGCGASPEKIEKEIEKFVEAHENITAALVMDSFLIGTEEGLKAGLGDDVDVIKDVDFEKYKVYEGVLKEEKKNLKSIKSKPLKELNKVANEYYEGSSKLIEKFNKGKIDIDEYIDKVDELGTELFESIEDGKIIDEYNKLREKAEMDEYELDIYDLTADCAAKFKDIYEDDVEKLYKEIMKKALKDIGQQLDYNDILAGLEEETSTTTNKLEEVDDKSDKNEKNEGKKDSSNVKEFVKSLAKNKEEEDEFYSDNGDSASIYLSGKNDGKLDVYASSEDGKIDYITVTLRGEGDERELSERMIGIVKKFCKEANLDEKDVLKEMKKLYDETSSDEFLESSQAKDDLEKYDFVTNEITSDDIMMDMIIYDPEKSLTKKVQFTIMKR